MNPDRWPEVSRVFAGASALGGKERAAYLDDACVGDPELRAEVESLLVAHDAAGPLDRSPLGVAADIAASPARRLTVGARLGPYQIESWVGAGGMGEVYRALDTKLGRAVAIKVLPDSVAHEGDRRSRLEREARALAALNHPHVGAIYGLEESGDVAALVLEFVDGPTLDQRLARGRLSIDEITHIARQLAEALEAAHDSGIVHRDLKPANIKITPGGNVKVLDFGLAKAIGAPIADVGGSSRTRPTTSTATQDGTIVGTPGYMSPEQARGDAVDKRADIWAFGCVVFEMCSGLAPFAGAHHRRSDSRRHRARTGLGDAAGEHATVPRAPPSPLPDEGSEAPLARHRRGAHRSPPGCGRRACGAAASGQPTASAADSLS